MKEYWLDGIMGVLTGDALGDPVQFESREEVACHPVTGMRGGGAYAMPAGTWTDDSSMTLATLTSISKKHRIDLQDMMNRFVDWLEKGEYTPFGQAFDEGGCTVGAILRYERTHDPLTCGGSRERDNGNGSLMRILPVCIFCWEEERAGRLTQSLAVFLVHQASGLTHRHIRAKIGCGLYYFMVKAILDDRYPGPEAVKEDRTGKTDLLKLLQKGIQDGFDYYEELPETAGELTQYHRLKDPDLFRETPGSKIQSTGYIVDTLEAAVWSLLRTASFREALLTAVNLGNDADTVGAVAGGLAGLYYGYGNIPKEWLEALQRRGDVEKLCRSMEEKREAQC